MIDTREGGRVDQDGVAGSTINLLLINIMLVIYCNFHCLTYVLASMHYHFTSACTTYSPTVRHLGNYSLVPGPSHLGTSQCNYID